jgi:peptide/nickel transport system permease protein
LLRFILHRILLSLPSLAGVIILAFLLIHLVPGDPVDLMLGEQASQQDREALRRDLGLDQPLPKQFISYLGQLVTFEFGRSLVSRESVGREIAFYFPGTLQLSLAAMLLALLWGLPLGVQAAVHPRSIWSRAADLFGLIGMSVPAVFLGPLLVYIFAIKLDLLPVSDALGPEYLILPSLSLAIPLGAVILRMTRASVTEVLHEDFIRTARSKGLSERTINFKHALRNALIPIVTIVSLQLGALLTGTVITETIFDWPGIGTLLYGAIQRRDYPVVQACILMVAFIYILVNLLGDLMYGVVNPRVRLGGQ